MLNGVIKLLTISVCTLYCFSVICCERSLFKYAALILACNSLNSSDSLHSFSISRLRLSSVIFWLASCLANASSILPISTVLVVWAMPVTPGPCLATCELTLGSKAVYLNAISLPWLQVLSEVFAKIETDLNYC